MPIPPKQRIYQFVIQFIEAQGFAPSLREIAMGVGLSPRSVSLVSRSLHALVKEGKLELEKGCIRNIRLKSSSHLGLPFVGRIAAGSPIEAIAESETFELGTFFNRDHHYILEVQGDSMIDEGILDGDKIICKRQTIAKEGDIVVVLIDQHEATLKRIHYQPKDYIILAPANAALKPRAYLAHRIKIQGVFVGLIRLLHKR